MLSKKEKIKMSVYRQVQKIRSHPRPGQRTELLQQKRLSSLTKNADWLPSRSKYVGNNTSLSSSSSSFPPIYHVQIIQNPHVYLKELSQEQDHVIQQMAELTRRLSDMEKRTIISGDCSRDCSLQKKDDFLPKLDILHQKLKACEANTTIVKKLKETIDQQDVRINQSTTLTQSFYQQLKASLEKLQNEVTNAISTSEEITTIKNSISDTTTLISQLQTTIFSTQSACDGVDEKLSTIDHQIQLTNQSITAAHQNIVLVENKTLSYLQQFDQFRSRIVNLLKIDQDQSSSVITVLEKQINQITKQLQSHLEVIRSIEKNLKENIAECGANVNTKTQSLQDQILSLQQLFENQQKAFTQWMQDNKFTQHNNQLTQHNNQLTQHNNQLTQHTTQLTEHNNQINQQNAQLTEHDNQLTQHNNQLTEHDNQLTEHDNQITQQNTQLTEHTTQLTEHTNQLTEHNNQLTQQNTQLTKHTTQLTEHTTQLTQHNNQLTQHNTKINQHTTQLTELNHEQRTGNITLNQNISSLTTKIKQQITTFTDQFLSMNTRQMDEIKKQISEVSVGLNLVKTDLLALETKFFQMIKSCTNTDDLMAIRAEYIQLLNTESQKLQKDQTTVISNLSDQTTAMQKEYRDLSHRTEEIMNERYEQIQMIQIELKEEKNTSSSNYKQLQALHQAAVEGIRMDMEKELIERKQHYDTLEKTMGVRFEQLEKKIDHIYTQHNLLNQQNQTAQQTDLQHNTHLKQLQEKTNQLSQATDELSQTTNHHQLSIQTMSKQYETLQKRYQQLHTLLVSNMEDAERSNQSVRELIELHKKIETEYKDMVEMYDKQQTDYKNSLENRDNKLQQLESQVKEQLHTMENRITQLHTTEPVVSRLSRIDELAVPRYITPKKI